MLHGILEPFNNIGVLGQDPVIPNTVPGAGSPFGSVLVIVERLEH